jgi:hypothetical protein
MFNRSRRSLVAAALASVSLLALAAIPSAALAGAPLIVPDNGTGTASHPPVGGLYHTPDDDMYIIDGLPPGTNISADAKIDSFFYNMGGGAVYSFPGVPSVPGGMLGGTKWASDGILHMPLIGHGALAGFNRDIPIPFSFEIHTAPTMNGAPFQSYDAHFFRGFGQVTGDPDFDLLRVVAGTDFGLPSPGHTTLTQAGPGWSIDSFFDITYRIDFVGHPGSPLGGQSGSTTGTIRFRSAPAPGAATLLGLAGVVALRRRRR